MAEISKTGFWTGDSAHVHHVHCPPLAQWIVDFLKDQKDKQIYDFGCGMGKYLKTLQDAGFKKLQGFEGDPPRKGDYFNNIYCQDLTQPFTLPEKGNCIFLEVAEHVPAQYETQLLKNVTDACDNILISSWAIRGQGGFGHVNCLDNHEAIDRFEKLGFTYLEKESKDGRSIIDSSAGWFKNTLMIFKR